MSTTLTTRTGRETTLGFVATAAAAPFVGLAFVVLMPLAGLAAITWFTLKALVTSRRTWLAVRDVALFVAAPVIGLAYILLLPVVGLVTLAAIEFRTIRAAPAHA